MALQLFALVKRVGSVEFCAALVWRLIAMTWFLGERDPGLGSGSHVLATLIAERVWSYYAFHLLFGSLALWFGRIVGRATTAGREEGVEKRFGREVDIFYLLTAQPSLRHDLFSSFFLCFLCTAASLPAPLYLAMMVSASLWQASAWHSKRDLVKGPPKATLASFGKGESARTNCSG